MTTTVAGLFDELYGATKEAIQNSKKPIIKRKLQRKFKAAYDSACSQIIDAEAELDKVRRNFDDIDINNILELKDTKIAAEETKKAIAEEYQIMFNEEMQTIE